MHTRFIRGVNVIVALSLVAAGCGVTGLSNVAVLCAAAAFNVKVILGNGVGGWSGQNAAGVAVTVEPSGGVATTKTTDAGGCVSFDSAPGGMYDVSAVPPAQLPASAKKIRDLNVAETGREIVLWLTHRLPTNAVPARPVSGPFTGTLTGTLRTESGVPQSGDNDNVFAPGELGVVNFTALFIDDADAAGTFTILRTGMSNDRPAVTGSLFGGNWDGVGMNAAAVLGLTHEYFTRYAYMGGVNLVGPGPLSVGNFDMQLVTGSRATTLDAQGTAFVAAFDSPPIRGLSVTDLFLYNSIHSGALWLATVYHDSGVTSVTTPIPQIPLDQGVYWYGLGAAGSFNPSTGTLSVFGETTTFLVTGAPALNISYLPRPGDPVVGAGSQPTITWTASSGATAYEIDILTSPGGQLVFVGATSTSLSIALPNVLAAGSYTVRVFAFDSLTSRDFVAGAGRGQGGNPAVQPMGSVLRPKDFEIQGLRSNRREASRQLQTLMSAFRPGGPLRRPQLDQTPLSNNDDRVSWSSVIAFTR